MPSSCARVIDNPAEGRGRAAHEDAERRWVGHLDANSALQEDGEVDEIAP
jgi:hypothetical protein